MAFKKHDFIEIEYTGRLKDDNSVFDTTDEKLAKESKIDDGRSRFGSVIVCLGEGQLVSGLEKGLEGKELGTHKFELKPEESFGKKSSKLIQLVPTQKFLEKNIKPFPGLQLNIDGAIGTVRTVSGGRTIVDFNNPLAGKDVVYELKVLRIVTDPKEKVKSLLGENIPADFKEGKLTLTIETHDLSEDAAEQLKNKIKDVISEVKEVELKHPEHEKKVVV